ncbi:MAG: DHH family phosphoesterase [Candidatus Micrarchaeota archaeon]|nr:DHH family phosphoesterase [Candidatus Micrarchaeota archaeon]
MAEKISFNELLNFLILNKDQKFLITFHSMGDRDSVGAAVALQSYLSRSVIATPDFITSTSKRLLASLHNAPQIITKIPKDVFGIIVLDANTPVATGKFEKEIGKSKKPVVFIDHHESAKPDASKATMFIDERYNSTSSLITNLLHSLGVKLGRDASLSLLNGIVADSAEFHNMHAETFKQVAMLLENSGISYSTFMMNFDESPPPENRLSAISDLCSARKEAVGKYLIAYGETSLHANVAAETAINVGADASVFWAIGKKEVSISARIRPPLEKHLQIHLGRMMWEIGDIIGGNGGGHAAAAGAYGPKKEMSKKATDRLISQVKQKLSE